MTLELFDTNTYSDYTFNARLGAKKTHHLSSFNQIGQKFFDKSVQGRYTYRYVYFLTLVSFHEEQNDQVH